MKNLLSPKMLLIVVFLCTVACSTESIELEEPTLETSPTLDPEDCLDEEPKARVTNNSNILVDMEIFDEEGILINSVYGVHTGADSEWQSFATGIISVVISTEQSTKAIRMDMGSCMTYHVTIDENYQLDTHLPIQL